MCRNYNDEKATMEMQRTGEFDREHQGKMVLKSLADRAGSKQDQLNEVRDKITKSKGQTSALDKQLLDRYTDELATLQQRVDDATKAVQDAHNASIVAIPVHEFASFIQALADGVVAIREHVGVDLYSDLDAKQLNVAVQFLLGGAPPHLSFRASASSPGSNTKAAERVSDFDAAGEVLRLLGVARRRPGEKATENPRAVKMVVRGLKQLKQTLVCARCRRAIEHKSGYYCLANGGEAPCARASLYEKLQVDDIKAILYHEVLALFYETKPDEVPPAGNPYIRDPAASSKPTTPATPYSPIHKSFSKGLRRVDSRKSEGFGFTGKVAGDAALFRPEPHFVSKAGMRRWKSVLHVYEATRVPLLDASDQYGPRDFVEALGLTCSNVEEVYKTIYVQPLLTFNVSISGGIHVVQVPDWLDWDPGAFFYSQATPSRMALPHPLSNRLNADDTAMLGGMVHELKGLYAQGHPTSISFTYLPRWKLSELENRIHRQREVYADGLGEEKEEKEEEGELMVLERMAKICRRRVTVEDMCQIVLAQGHAVLHQDAGMGPMLTLGEGGGIQDILSWESLNGCYIQYSPATDTKSTAYKSRKQVIGFDPSDRTLHIEHTHSKAGGGGSSLSTKKKVVGRITEQHVRYRLIAEMVFRIVAKDDERIVIRRMPAVPSYAKALDAKYPFVGDELVLPRAAALRLHVRAAQLLPAVKSQGDDARSIATTFVSPSKGSVGGGDSPPGLVSASKAAIASGEKKAQWRLLDGCEKGELVAMHDFTFCKCVMLSVVRAPGRHGPVQSTLSTAQHAETDPLRGPAQWLPLLSGCLDIDMPPAPVAIAKESVRRSRADESAKVAFRTRFNRSAVHMLALDLKEFFRSGFCMDGDSTAGAGLSAAPALATPLHLALCDVSELHAEDADVALGEMGIKAVLDCGSAQRLIPTPPGGSFGGAAVPLAVGCGVAPWQLAQGKPSPEGIDYCLLAYEDHNNDDETATAAFFEACRDFVVTQVSFCVLAMWRQIKVPVSVK